jgi:hypothetical protein
VGEDVIRIPFSWSHFGQLFNNLLALNCIIPQVRFMGFCLRSSILALFWFLVREREAISARSGGI